ncbi:hypothetical protein DLJ53_33610 [Acuticoccus sediminis]|uniref:Tellurite resistance protein TerB n=1 Tax=Acuticoccus sediminis TaxID=2184697 RepID=A0A8B2NCJ6_9HYPH|nr:TerB N-terminal domain-containing protein [Acuticoccus sediminis]RAH95938.1 hypothetical protein DLJ53_33610 [Acuticoccus sediminis]
MRRRLQRQEPAEWIGFGEFVSIHGYSIPGMVYVGSILRAQYYGGTKNCLIDPGLPISAGSSDKAGNSMPYWPSYSEIEPAARRTYLEWHAQRRRDPDIGIGYVFLYFYGLERRLLVDKALVEGPVITAEVERLLGIYGTNGSFHGYAHRFLAAANIAMGRTGSVPELSPDMRGGYEMSYPVRLHLGRQLAEKRPLAAEDALLWILSLPDTRLRTPATRCFEEFRELWQVRFAERHPKGLKVNPPKTKLKFEYRAASNTFSVELPVEGGTVPDIAAVSAPIEGLRDLVNACSDELDAYSRFLGRRPDAKASAEAIALLPKEILGSDAAAAAARIRSELEEIFGGQSIVSLPIERLIELLQIPLSSSGKITAAAAGQIGQCLDKLDMGFEPDRRYGPVTLTPNGQTVLFKAPHGGPVDAERPQYNAARTMVDVSVLAAAADGDIHEAEFRSVRDEIWSFDGLAEAERIRLSAHAILLLKDAPRQQAVMKRLAGLPKEEARRVTEAALSAVLADGHVDPSEIRFLEKLHKALGLPEADVYASLHRGQVVVDEPVSVIPEERSSGEAIPPAPVPEMGIALDHARLARLRKETSEVSSLLADIFVEDEDLVPTVAQAPAVEGGKRLFAGLDVEHGELLASLIAVGRLERERFEEMTQRLRLLPDGAIETINEWGFETFDEPVLEEDGDVVVVEHLLPELKKLEAAT